MAGCTGPMPFIFVTYAEVPLDCRFVRTCLWLTALIEARRDLAGAYACLEQLLALATNLGNAQRDLIRNSQAAISSRPATHQTRKALTKESTGSPRKMLGCGSSRLVAGRCVWLELQHTRDASYRDGGAEPPNSQCESALACCALEAWSRESPPGCC